MKSDILKYHPSLKPFSRKLRKESTLSEILLWDKIKNKQLGVKFLRQKPIDNFVVDFYSKELKLAIEIDGSSHNDKMEADKMRQKKLEELGIKFLRFDDADVKIKIDNVVRTIEAWIKDNLTDS